MFITDVWHHRRSFAQRVRAGISAHHRFAEKTMGASSTSSAHSRWTGFHSPPYVAGTVPFRRRRGEPRDRGPFPRTNRPVISTRDPAIVRGEPNAAGLAATGKSMPVAAVATRYHPIERISPAQQSARARSKPHALARESTPAE
ncbi:hypothetical protein K523DRAFT_158229, partial [Schizophyllum commune Tattone D]